MIIIALTLAALAYLTLKLMEDRLYAAIKAGSAEVVRVTARAYIAICKSASSRNKLILTPILCLLSFLNQLFFNIGFRLGQRLILRLYRDNLRAEVDELRLHLQDYPIYLNLLRSLVDPFKELNRVAGGRQGGRNFGEGHKPYSANDEAEARRQKSTEQ